MRYSGHETFPFRYPWLPKSVRAVASNPHTFSNEDQAMVDLGLGKNMVKAARFWVEATGMVSPGDKGLAVTPLGRALILDEAHDPFLEDIQTLWLVHWMISTNPSPIAAWDYLLNKWHDPRMTKSGALAALKKLSEGDESKKKELSDVTLNQHFDVFLHTYVPTRSRKGDVQEDNLDSPLVELGLLLPEVTTTPGRSLEPTFSFRVDEKPEIRPALFAWCLERYWDAQAKGENSIPFQMIAYGHGSLGQILKISEDGIRQRLEAIGHDTDGRFTFNESSSIPNVVINPAKPASPLSAIFAQEPSLAYA